ncbi:MAG: phytanoyl-CoA dioxygenase family protein, partial [Candidatus Latescibacteria bacterium]|nr:phytanoyl-CoA dioxygenase family protein [Candidatus Latescibacterota bacterium]
NAWSLLPWSIEEGERVATADRRNIIPVSGVDPYAWKGYEKPPRSIHIRDCKAVKELAGNQV